MTSHPTSTASTASHSPRGRSARRALALAGASAILAGVAGAAAVPASAATGAGSPAQGAPAATVLARSADAPAVAVDGPRALTVRAEAGAVVLAAAKGQPVRRAVADATGVARLTGLEAGRPYRVTADGRLLGSAVPVVAPLPPVRMVVESVPGEAAATVRWEQPVTARTGAVDTTTVRAVDASAAADPGIAVTVEGTSARIEGLRDGVRYRFEAIAANGAGASAPATATMREPFRAASAAAATGVRAAQPAVTAPEGAPPVAPTRRTVTECPAGTSPWGAACRRTAPHELELRAYAFRAVTSTKPYAYHDEVTGPAPLIRSFETRDVCPAGMVREDYGAQGIWCKEYGPAPTARVKDAPPTGWTDDGTQYSRTDLVRDETPAGWTDNGTAWQRVAPAPAGWTDDGTQYVQVVAPVTREITG